MAVRRRLRNGIDYLRALRPALRDHRRYGVPFGMALRARYAALEETRWLEWFGLAGIAGLLGSKHR